MRKAKSSERLKSQGILQSRNEPAVKSLHWRNKQNTEVRTCLRTYKRWLIFRRLMRLLTLKRRSKAVFRRLQVFTRYLLRPAGSEPNYQQSQNRSLPRILRPGKSACE